MQTSPLCEIGYTMSDQKTISLKITDIIFVVQVITCYYNFGYTTYTNS